MASSVKDKDNGYRKFFVSLQKLGGLELVAGVPAGAGGAAGGVTVADIAQFHEFGTSKVKARSFIRSTFDVNQRKYGRLLEDIVKNFIKKKRDPKPKMFVLAQTVKNDIQNRIRNKEIRQDLKQSTIDRKGSDIALVDTGLLVRSITAIVRKEGAGA